MNMGVEIERVVQDLGRVTIKQVLYEAIMNAIDADAKNINIVINYKTLGKELPCYINSMTVTDDGDGFNTKNTESFGIYKSTHKQEIGAKGVGRFLFLKLFDKISIVSLDKNIEFDINDVAVTDRINDNSNKTIVNFSDANENEAQIELDKIENDIKEHFLPYFHLIKTRKEQKIKINLIANDKNIFTINSEDIPDLKTDEFKLKGHTFTIDYVLNYYDPQKNNCFYCADNRVVLKNNTTQKQNPKLTKLKSFSDVNILFLLSGKYLNTKVIGSRDNFNIYPKNKKSMFDELSWDDIQDKLSVKLKKILLNNDIDVEKNSTKELESAIEKAPYLSEYLTDNQYGKDSAKLINEAEKKLNEDKQILRNGTHGSQQEYKTKLSLTTQAELSEYIFDRQKIIDSLKKITNEETLEQEMHNLFMKKNTSDESRNYKGNNLWLFDDRFMIYDKIFSDQQIRKIFPELSSNLCRPDILSVVSNTYIKDDITDIVIIELKKPTNKITPAGAEEQLLKYARYVNQSSDDNKIRIWAYAFLTFSEEAINSLNDKSYNKIPTHSENPIYYKYHGANSVIINFMDYFALADDANTRNTTFMNILKSKSTINQ